MYGTDKQSVVDHYGKRKPGSNLLLEDQVLKEVNDINTLPEKTVEVQPKKTYKNFYEASSAALLKEKEDFNKRIDGLIKHYNEKSEELEAETAKANTAVTAIQDAVDVYFKEKDK